METKAYYKKHHGAKSNLGPIQRAASAVGGAYLISSALKDPIGKPFSSFFKLIAGGFLSYRSLTGFCAFKEAFTLPGKVLNIRSATLVRASPYEVYLLWRDLANLPNFMKHLSLVQVLDEKRSKWVAKIPGGMANIEWEAEILIDKKGEELSWHSVANAEIENSGKIVFEGVNGGQSTKLNVTITYSPPAGRVGKAVSLLLNEVFEKMVWDDLKRFKEMAEGDDIQTIQVKPSQSNGQYV